MVDILYVLFSNQSQYHNLYEVILSLSYQSTIPQPLRGIFYNYGYVVVHKASPCSYC
jgi:hypothetical protein